MSNFQFPISNYEEKAISCGIISVDEYQRGQLLFELLIALSIAAVVLTLGGQLVSLGLRASKVANNRGVGTGRRRSCDRDAARVFSSDHAVLATLSATKTAPLRFRPVLNL
jgi:hypothetical protein